MFLFSYNCLHFLSILPPHPSQFYLWFYLLIFRERGREKGSEKSMDWLPQQGQGYNPDMCPDPGIKPMTFFHLLEACLTNWAICARAWTSLKHHCLRFWGNHCMVTNQSFENCKNISLGFVFIFSAISKAS